MKRQQSILVVDDDREMLRMLNRTLELEGYGVDIAADGRPARLAQSLTICHARCRLRRKRGDLPSEGNVLI